MKLLLLALILIIAALCHAKYVVFYVGSYGRMTVMQDYELQNVTRIYEVAKKEFHGLLKEDKMDFTIFNENIVEINQHTIQQYKKEDPKKRIGEGDQNLYSYGTLVNPIVFNVYTKDLVKAVLSTPSKNRNINLVWQSGPEIFN